MATSADWPATRWELSAPESYVLREGPRASGSAAFKLGLTELVARGTLVLETVEGRQLYRRTHVPVLRNGPRAGMPREQPLAGIWQVYRHSSHTRDPGKEPGVAVDELARTAVMHYQSLGRYVAQDVLPTLIERGFYESRQGRVLWAFPKTSYLLTPAGESNRAELQQWLDIGTKRLARWSDRDSSQAAAVSTRYAFAEGDLPAGRNVAGRLI